jgi:hypothetical protein
MDKMFTERPRAELVMFAIGFFGFWLTIWGVILPSTWIGIIGALLILGVLAGFALRDSD